MSWLSQLLGQDEASKAQTQSDTAVQTAQDIYGNLQPYRALGLSDIMNAGTLPDYSKSFAGGPQYAPVTSANQTAAQNAETASLDSLTQTPDRLAQAKSALSDFDAQAAPAMAAARRQVGQSASTLGRLGSGGVTTSLGNIESDYERNRMTTEDQLLSSALDAAQQDKLNTLGAAQSVEGQDYAQGAAERANLQGVQAQQQQTAEQQLAAELQGEQQQFGQGLSLSGLGFTQSPVSTELAAAGGNQNTANAQGGAAGNVLGAGASLLSLFG